MADELDKRRSKKKQETDKKEGVNTPQNSIVSDPTNNHYKHPKKKKDQNPGLEMDW